MGGFCLFFCCHNLYEIKSRKQQERPKGYGFCTLSIARLNRKKQNTPIWQTHKKTARTAKRLRVLQSDYSSPQPKKAKHAHMANSQKTARTAKRLRVLQSDYSSPQPKKAEHAHMADSQKTARTPKRLRVLHAEHSSPQPKKAKHAHMA